MSPGAQARGHEKAAEKIQESGGDISSSTGKERYVCVPLSGAVGF